MKKIFSTFIVALLTLCAVFSLSGCFGGDEPSASNEKTSNSAQETTDETEIDSKAPVYQGMTAGSAATELSEVATFSSSIKMQAPPMPPHDEEHPWYCYHCNHYFGDYRGWHDHFPPDYPFDYDHNHDGKIDDDEKKGDVDDAGKDLVDGASASIYYTEQNKDFYITIHLNNPCDYEILSFTLNGKRYSSYMFEAGSDMENIVLKLNVGDSRGVLNYTIDAIKYVDGTQIKDVVMNGDKTVQVGVHTENAVSANVYDEKITYKSVSFKADIQDPDRLVDFSDGEVHVVLYDGETVLKDNKLDIGKPDSVSFDNLLPDTIYQYAIISYHDDFDDNGFSAHVIYKKSFVTDYLVLFDDITVLSDGISFDFSENEKISGITIDNIRVIKDESLIENVSPNNLVISDLLSETEYLLKTEFYYDGTKYDISLLFTTLAKGVPVVSVTDLQSTYDSVSFDINVTDEDKVGEISKIEIIDEAGNSVKAENANIRSFSGLLSDKTYTIRVTYAYDPNTGNSLEVTAQSSIKTKAKTAPSFSFDTPVISWNGVDIKYVVTDDADAIVDLYVALLDGNDVVSKINDRNKAVYNKLKCGYDYKVKAVITYNPNNGSANAVIEKTLDVTTSVYKDSNGAHYAVQKNNEVAIVGYDNGITEGAFESSVCGYPVTSVKAYAFRNCSTLENLTFPSSMIEIGNSAFEECRNLKTVEFNDGLKTIDDRAFKWCSNVKTVVIPASVENVGSEAVSFGVYCSDTTIYAHWTGGWFSADKPSGWSFDYAERVSGSSDYVWGESTVFDFKEFITDGTFVYALKNCGTLTVVEYLTPDNQNVVIPDSFEDYPVTEIGIKCFAEIKIKSVSLPKSLETIHKYAFYRSNGIYDYSKRNDLTFPSSTTEIGKYAFSDSFRIDKLIFKSTPSIGQYAFSNGEFYSIEFNIVFPDEYEEYYFDSEMVSGTVASYAFYNCQYLKLINIPANYMYLENNVFDGCPDIYVACLAERRRSGWDEHFEGTSPTIYWKSYIDDNGVIYCVNDEIKYNEQSTLSVTGYLGSDFETIIRDTIGDKIVTVVKTDAFFDSTAHTIYYPHTIQVFGERCFGVYDNGHEIYGTEYYGTYNDFAYTIDEDAKTASIIKYLGDDLTPVLPESINGYKVVSIKIETYQLDMAEYNDAYYLGSETNPYFALMKFNDNEATSYTVIEGTKIIANLAFSWAPKLEEISIPLSLEYIDYDAFASCPRLIDITNLSRITIEKGSDENGRIGLNALSVHDSPDNSEIEFATTENGLVFAWTNETTILYKYVGTDTKIELPHYINGKPYKIYKYAFYNCKNVSEVIIPDEVTEMGSCAFKGCSSLTKISVGNGIESIKSFTFYYCNNLKEVKLSTSLNNMENYAFPSEGEFLKKENDIYYLDNWVYKASSDIKVANIKKGTLGIANNAFNGCSSLTTVTFPEELKYISDYAFYGCSSLTEIKLFENVVSIGNYAFSNCSSLQAATLSEGIIAIKSCAFGNCKMLTSIKLPSTLSEIGSYAFSGTSLTEITIPANVTTIGGGAFSECSTLKSATFENPNGWLKHYRYRDPASSSYSKIDLSDPKKAAAWLSDKYNAWDYSLART